MHYFSSFILRGVGLVLALGLSIILARQFSKQAVGEYFLFVQILMVFGAIVRFGSDYGLLKHAQFFNREQKKKALRYSSSIFFYMFLPALIAFLIYSQFGFYQISFDEPFNLIFVFLVILPISFIYYTSTYLRGLNEQNLAMIIQFNLIPTIIILGIFLTKIRLDFIYFIAIGLCFSVSIYFYIINNAVAEEAGAFKDYKIELKSFFSVVVLNVIVGALDSLMIGGFVGAEGVAEYTMANKLATASSVILVIVNGIVGPLFSRYWKEKNSIKIRKYFQKITKYLLIVSSVIFLIIVIFGRQILGVLYGEAYEAVYLVLVILGLAQFIVVATGPVAFILMMSGDTKYHLRSLYIAVAINIALNTLLIPLMGVLGAAIATAISIAAKNSYSFYIANKKFGLLKYDAK